jgi:hypothetical protein
LRQARQSKKQKADQPGISMRSQVAHKTGYYKPGERPWLPLHPTNCHLQGAIPMNLKSLALIAAMAITVPIAFAQTTDPGAKQDMKNAGSDTKHAATSTGHGVSKGSKTAYNKTKSGTEKGYDKTKSGTETGYHKTAHATKTGVNKVEGKPNTPANNPPQ